MPNEWNSLENSKTYHKEKTINKEIEENDHLISYMHARRRIYSSNTICNVC